MFLPGRSEMEFVCVCDTLRQRKSVLDQLNKAEVSSKKSLFASYLNVSHFWHIMDSHVYVLS